MRAVQVGWDGRSQPIIELRAACGCSWTRDGQARLSVCTTCLHVAVTTDAEVSAWLDHGEHTGAF